ncbi:MAG TPA: nuclear transport factor 2 family protein [Thermoleophilaceae bacterium]
MLRREHAAAFVEGYGRTWERWDIPGFVDLFSDEVVYVAHPTQETVVGRTALASYLRKEATEQGDVNVRMGSPVIEGDRVAAEFWVTATSGDEGATIAGCLIARLQPDGRCGHFREYWFDLEGHTSAFEGWGE